MTLSNHKIEIDLTLLVQDFYPALTTKQTESIAYRIAKDFDYSELYEQIHHNIVEVANNQGIDLVDKDGIYTDESPNLTVIQGGLKWAEFYI